MKKLKYPRVRDILNRLKWVGDAAGIVNIELVVMDRTTETGHKAVPFTDIIRLGKREFETATATIPYYKVVRIVRHEGTVVWERGKP